jgi:hypothetical protein
MEGNAETVSRPPKLNHVETILYEMNMLDYCYSRLRERKWANAPDYYLCIEGFLLHYRNLIEFFGNHQGLRAGEPQVWSPGRTLSNAEVASIQNGSLLEEYHGSISRYLGHCDEIRAEKDRDWKHIEMYAKIEPLLTNFRKLFPPQRRMPRKVPGLDATSVSTATVFSHGSLIEDYNDAAPVKKPNK